MRRRSDYRSYKPEWHDEPTPPPRRVRSVLAALGAVVCWAAALVALVGFAFGGALSPD